MTDTQKETLLSTPLFRGIAPADADALLACLAPTLRDVPRDGTVFAAGDVPRRIGAVSGAALRVRAGGIHRRLLR